MHLGLGGCTAAGVCVTVRQHILMEVQISNFVFFFYIYFLTFIYVVFNFIIIIECDVCYEQVSDSCQWKDRRLPECDIYEFIYTR